MTADSPAQRDQVPKRDQVPERPIFEAVLYPYHSLTQRTYLILGLGTFLIMAVYALIFLTTGAWPIFCFMGAEWLLFWYLFSRHSRGDCRAERLRLFSDRLIVEHIDKKGRLQTFLLQPYWLQVILDRASTGSTLFLRTHGHVLEIGTFLSHPERLNFASELTRVLNHQRASTHHNFIS